MAFLIIKPVGRCSSLIVEVVGHEYQTISMEGYNKTEHHEVVETKHVRPSRSSHDITLQVLPRPPDVIDLSFRFCASSSVNSSSPTYESIHLSSHSSVDSSIHSTNQPLNRAPTYQRYCTSLPLSLISYLS
jgi:hypothetical protein